MAPFGFERTPLSDEQLRDALFDAVAGKDWRTLMKLWRVESDRIRRLFPTWSSVPPHVRTDRVRAHWWAEGLVGVVSVALRAGDQTLLAALQGDPKDDGTTDYLPTTYGALGEAHLSSGDIDRARAYTLLALEQCRATGDEAGIHDYARNLARMEFVPPTAFRTADGQHVAGESIAPGTTLYCAIEAGRCLVPGAAAIYHQRGREARHGGDYHRAIYLLTAAAVLAPRWSYPVYDRATTHLLAGDAASALSDYRHSLELGRRGCFHAITAVHTLQREREGELPAGTWVAFVALQHRTGESGLARRDALRRFVTQVPRFAPAWLQFSQLERSPTRRMATLEQGFAASPDAETAGMLQINKALAVYAAEPALGHRMLTQTESDPKATPATQNLARLLSTLAAPQPSAPTD